MGQGLKYGIAAAGTLILLTILSWNADENAKRREQQQASRTIIGGSTESAPPAVSVTPLAKTEDTSSAKKPAVTSLGADSGPSKTATPKPTNIDTKTTAPKKPESKADKTSTPKTPATTQEAPKDSAKPKAPALAQADSSKDRASWRKHQVKEGESLYSIASYYLGNGTKWPAILKANPRLKSAAHVRSGMTLLIPVEPGCPTTIPEPKQTLAQAPKKTPSSAFVPTDTASDTAGDHETLEVSTASSTKAGKHYTVQPGDTLSSIAASQMGTRSAWKKLYKANKHVLASPNHLKLGQKLTIPQ